MVLPSQESNPWVARERSAYLALVQAGAGQYGLCGVGRQRAQARGVGDGFDLVQQLEVGEVVHVHLVLQRHHHAIAPQPHGPHLAAERQLADAAALVVVPDHHLAVWVIDASPSRESESVKCSGALCSAKRTERTKPVRPTLGWEVRA